MVIEGLFGSPLIKPLLGRQRFWLDGVRADAVSVNSHPDSANPAPLCDVHQTLLAQPGDQNLSRPLGAVSHGRQLMRCERVARQQVNDAGQAYRLHLFLGGSG